MRNCKKGGLVFFAPPCSTWVFLILSSKYCMSSNKNTKQFYMWVTQGVHHLRVEHISVLGVHLHDVCSWQTSYACACCICSLVLCSHQWQLFPISFTISHNRTWVIPNAQIGILQSYEGSSTLYWGYGMRISVGYTFWLSNRSPPCLRYVCFKRRL